MFRSCSCSGRGYVTYMEMNVCMLREVSRPSCCNVFHGLSVTTNWSLTRRLVFAGTLAKLSLCGPNVEVWFHRPRALSPRRCVRNGARTIMSWRIHLMLAVLLSRANMKQDERACGNRNRSERRRMVLACHERAGKPDRPHRSQHGSAQTPPLTEQAK